MISPKFHPSNILCYIWYVVYFHKLSRLYFITHVHLNLTINTNVVRTLSSVVGTLGRFITKNYYQPIQINSIDITTSQDEFQLKFATTNNGRFRKLWHLAYTLVRNPNLKELRRRDKRESKTTDRHTQQFLSPVASYSIFDIVNEEKNKEFS